MFVVIADLCEHTEFLSPSVSGLLVSSEQESGKESGKPLHPETEPDEGRRSRAEATNLLPGHTAHQENTDISVKATSDDEPSTNSSSERSSHSVSPKHRKRLLGIFRRETEKTASAPSSQKEQVKISEMDEPTDVSNLLKDAAHSSMNKLTTVDEEAKLPEMTEVRTLQLTALQKTQFKDIMTSDNQSEDSNPQMIFTRVQASKELPKTGREAPQDVQTDSVESSKYHLPPQTGMTEQCSSPQKECSILKDLATGDGTYRANPVLICEETDVSLPGSATEPQIPHRVTSIVSNSLNVTDNSLNPGSSETRTAGDAEDVQSTSHRVFTLPQERPRSPSRSPAPTSKQEEDEVRRSPSKTCHPRVLPRESSSPKRSRLEGPPLRTFPIDINPQTKAVEEQLGKPTPLPRQKKTPSPEAKPTGWTDTEPGTETTSPPLKSDSEDEEAYIVHDNPSQSPSSCTPQYKKGSVNLGTSTCLARSFIPQDYQHYLGPQEKAHVPPFHQDKAPEESPGSPSAADTDVVHRQPGVLHDSVGYQSESSAEGLFLCYS